MNRSNELFANIELGKNKALFSGYGNLLAERKATKGVVAFPVKSTVNVNDHNTWSLV